ncbi:Biopterin-dependent aromatic amino acid hydroxylase-domain-containing protein [Phlyctochytrium arcticum]|nr:Biopterin-dependent aromatic amino acid hydroxylase-domain-containing protein [Phlyctochytrium arcticum]
MPFHTLPRAAFGLLSRRAVSGTPLMRLSANAPLKASVAGLSSFTSNNIMPLRSNPTIVATRGHGSQASAVAHEPPHTEAPTTLRTTLRFTIADKVGALDQALSKLKSLNVSLSRIESRPSRTHGIYDIYVDFHAANESEIESICEQLRGVVTELQVVSTGKTDLVALQAVPWFPRKKSDMDSFAEKVMEYGADLDADHPGFKDPAYRERRNEITRIAKTYRYGEALPRIEYTAAEIKTWGAVYNQLTSLYKTHACREHQYVLPLLEHNCGYHPDNIPQLEDVSRFLKESTGWTLRPVMGLLSSRDFLNALAFRVFHSTQYIRHHSRPLYTPEPDVCHELLGHVPLYADPDFADFSQEIGLASLGASDDDIEKLATIYWFTVEFGLCQQGDKVKAYGAGLLSSFGELDYALSSKPKHLPFDPLVASTTSYPITEYQPLYFVASSFKDMKEQVRDYALENIHRPFVVRYQPLTETVEILDTKEKVAKYAQGIRGDMGRLLGAIEKMH